MDKGKDKLLDFLTAEIETHREKENASDKPWDRGFECGAMTEAIQLRVKVREFLMG